MKLKSSCARNAVEIVNFSCHTNMNQHLEPMDDEEIRQFNNLNLFNPVIDNIQPTVDTNPQHTLDDGLNPNGDMFANDL